MVDLRRELEADFLILADADRAATEAGERQQIVATRVRSRHGARIIHKHVTRNHRIPFLSLEEMQDAGLISISRLDRDRVGLRVTTDGHLHAKALRTTRSG